MNCPRSMTIPLVALLLAACVPSSQVTSAPSIQVPPARNAAHYGKAPDDVAGADARRLVSMFGQPRLDLREADMRKLQFSNGQCVLDAYLYPTRRRKEPVVKHVDTRLSDGRDVDPAACIAALRTE